jgi:putative inorganic carbon (HCO3(-)) transporter
MLVTFVSIMVLNSKDRIIALVTVTGISMGFWGFKGGLFTILTGGSNTVWGPPGSFIGDNNAMALATIMTIPILYFLRTVAKYQVLKIFLAGTMVLCVFSALGSQSRGALLGLISIGLFLALKSRKKFQYLLSDRGIGANRISVYARNLA